MDFPISHSWLFWRGLIDIGSRVTGTLSTREKTSDGRVTGTLSTRVTGTLTFGGAESDVTGTLTFTCDSGNSIGGTPWIFPFLILGFSGEA
jgi:hypothetical protein